MKLYVASSLRNKRQPGIVESLRAAGHEVYDFRHPDGNHAGGFQWSHISPRWELWTPRQFVYALSHPVALEGFAKDFDAMEWADAFVLVMPCGRSAHLEAGWAIGRKKPTAILLSDDGEPELMYRMADEICLDVSEVIAWLRDRASAAWSW